MKIFPVASNIYKPNFRGTFFYSTDDHGKNLDVSRGLSTVSKLSEERNDKNLPVFYINGGDFTTLGKNIEEILNIYRNFAKSGIKSIFSLGNFEASVLRDRPVDFKVIYEKMKQGLDNLSFVYTAKDSVKKNTKVDIEPYKILKDKVKTKDGGYKELNVAIIATGSDKSSLDYEDIENQKKALKKTIKQLSKEKNIDRVILVSHNFLQNNPDEDLNVFVHNELKKYSLPLDIVLMGHSHKVYKGKVPNTNIEVICSAPNGLGLLQIDSTEEGFSTPIMPKLSQALDGESDPYNYFEGDFLADGQNAIFTPYGKIAMEKPSKNYHITGSQEIVVSLEKEQIPKLRPTHRKRASVPSEIGTALANGMRDLVKESDFSVVYSLTARTPLRNADNSNEFSRYDVRSVIQDDFNLSLCELTAEQILDLFEQAFDKQEQGSNNPLFLEYSDNVVVTRNPKKTSDDKGKIKQIKIKTNNGQTIELFDRSGNLKDIDYKFKVVTDSFMPTDAAKRAGKIKLKDGFNVIKETKHTLSEALISELQKISRDETYAHCSEIKDL